MMSRLILVFLIQCIIATSFAFADAPLDCKCSDQINFTNGIPAAQLACSNGYMEWIRFSGTNGCFKRILELQAKIRGLEDGECACLSPYGSAAEIIKRKGNAPAFINTIQITGPYHRDFEIGTLAKPGDMNDLAMCNLIKSSLESSGVCRVH